MRNGKTLTQSRLRRNKNKLSFYQRSFDQGLRWPKGSLRPAKALIDQPQPAVSLQFLGGAGGRRRKRRKRRRRRRRRRRKKRRLMC